MPYNEKQNALFHAAAEGRATSKGAPSPSAARAILKEAKGIPVRKPKAKTKKAKKVAKKRTDSKKRTPRKITTRPTFRSTMGY